MIIPGPIILLMARPQCLTDTFIVKSRPSLELNVKKTKTKRLKPECETMRYTRHKQYVSLCCRGSFYLPHHNYFLLLTKS